MMAGESHEGAVCSDEIEGGNRLHDGLHDGLCEASREADIFSGEGVSGDEWVP